MAASHGRLVCRTNEYWENYLTFRHNLLKAELALILVCKKISTQGRWPARWMKWGNPVRAEIKKNIWEKEVGTSY